MSDGIVYAPPPVLDRRMTTQAFLRRFTVYERTQIEVLRRADTLQAAALNVYMWELDHAPYVSLDDETTIEGVWMLVGSVLTVQRAGEILNGPVQDKERYRE